MDERAGRATHGRSLGFNEQVSKELTLYAQQLAWLHAAPKRHKKDGDPIPRVESLDDDNPAKSLPEINGYLGKCFQLSGICLSGGMGVNALTWSEVDSFISRSGYPLNGWESEQIILMSRAYVNMTYKAKDLSCSPPYQEGLTDEDISQAMRDKVSKQWESFGTKLKPSKQA